MSENEAAALASLTGESVWISWKNGTNGRYIFEDVSGDNITVQYITEGIRKRHTVPYDEVRVLIQDKSPLDTHVEFLTMTARAKNLMLDLNVNTVSEMAELSTSKLVRRRNIASGTIKSINDALAAYGLRLKP